MSDWEIKHLQRSIERLEKEVHSQREDSRKESFGRFIWLMVVSNILFLFCFYHIVLRHDFNKFETKYQSSVLQTNDAPQKIQPSH